MKNNFTQMAFLTVDPILRAICNHPFNADLIDGTLQRERFFYYLQQDSQYLVAFGRALALAAGKLHTPDDIVLMLYFAEQGLLAERELHDYYFKQFQVPPAEAKSPACFAYCSHLLERAALGTPAEAMASLLPCFWIYREVGNHVRKLADEDNPYKKWIANYSGKEYSLLVDKAVALLDRLAGEAGDEEHQRMLQGFVASCRYEYNFWDDAYHVRACSFL